jgi:predicted acylesterase/phospholipase RssA
LKRYKIRRYWLLSLTLIVLTAAACAHYPKNQPLEEPSTALSYDFSRFDQPPGADETFVVLTFSGGGTRAACLSYGVLKELKNTMLPGTNRTVLEEVDVISTVSGGSFTGAYYALFGDRIFADFEAKFLKRNIQGELAGKVANPYNWFRLASPYFSRIDLAAELYDQTVFESASFDALAQKATRPFLIINATNLYQGARFEFTDPQFRYLGSDIGSYPVSRAVAASSAFPFLLSPISLVNYAKPPGYEISEKDQDAREDYWYNKRTYYGVYNNYIYAEPNGHENHPYLHLMDGGLADNIGLRAIYDLYVRGDIRSKINNGKIKRFLVIVVNSKADNPAKIDKKESPPGLMTVGFKTATLALDNYSFETVEMFKELAGQRIQNQATLKSCQQILNKNCRNKFIIPPLAGGEMKLYVADLTFDNIPLESATPGIKSRNYYNELPTTFYLPGDQVENLITVGGWLLKENSDFKDFLRGYQQ